MNSSFHSDRDFKANEQKFMDDLKNIFSKVGIKNQPVVFIIDKVNVVDEGIINRVITTICKTIGFFPIRYYIFIYFCIAPF